MRRFEFLDPEIVMERKQAATCAGCKKLHCSQWSGVRNYVCLVGAQKSSTDWTAMKRCKKYEELT